MTDREKKQMEILEKYIEHDRARGDSEHQYRVDQALSELSKLDAMPTSKEVEEAVKIVKEKIRLEFCKYALILDKSKWLHPDNICLPIVIEKPINELRQTLIQAVKPKEEVEQGRYNTQMLIEKMETQLDKGRNYLMSVRAENFNIEDALEAFGFGRNGLKL